VQGKHFKIRGEIQRSTKNVRLSTKNWSYLGNSEKYGQGYY